MCEVKKRKAIICDLDGTVADGNGRNFYDGSTCDKDLVREGPMFLMRALHELRLGMRLTGNGNKEFDIEFIFCSGREEKDRMPTFKWLREHFSPFDDFKLLMRKTGDSRKDSIIKREIYEKYIQPYYDVIFCLDDRQQVVDMWRKELNLDCFQVNYGDF